MRLAMREHQALGINAHTVLSMRKRVFASGAATSPYSPGGRHAEVRLVQKRQRVGPHSETHPKGAALKFQSHCHGKEERRTTRFERGTRSPQRRRPFRLIRWADRGRTNTQRTSQLIFLGRLLLRSLAQTPPPLSGPASRLLRPGRG
jgi:hypothetical protein